MPHAASIEYTPARLHDAVALSRMTRDWIENDLPWTWRPERIARLIDDPDATVLIARANRERIGFAAMHYGERRAHLNLLAVAPQARRRRVGASLLAWLEKTALVAGIERITLEVRADNPEARTFYRNLGYTEGRTIAGYYSGRRDAIRCHRQLRAGTPI